MALKVISEKLTGKTGFGGWSQVYDYKPEIRETSGEPSHLFVLISGKDSKVEMNAILDTREILSRIQNTIFNGPSVPGLSEIKNALETISAEEKHRGIEIALLLVMGDLAYLVALGGARLYLYRDTAFVPLLKSSAGKTLSASGKFKEEDLVLMGSDAFFRNFSGGILKASLQSRKVKEIAETFVPQIQSFNESGDIALISLKFEDEMPFRVNPQPSYDKPQAQALPENFISQTNANPGSLFRKPLYVKSMEPDSELQRKRKYSAVMGFILLGILLVSIFTGIKHKKSSDLKKTYNDELASAQHSLEEAEKISSISPERSRELFLDAKNKVLGLSTKNADDPSLKDLQKKIELVQGKLLGEFTDKPEIFVNLGLLSDGFSGSQMSLGGNSIFVLDTDNKRIVKVEIPSKHSEVIAGPSKVEESGPIAAYSESLYMANSKGIYSLSEEKKLVLEKTWQEPVLIYSFAGNLYLLEKTKNQILRFQGSGGVFSQGKPWLREGAEADLSDAKSWTIDGNIWVLKENGELVKLSQGNLASIKMDSPGQMDFRPDFIFTDDGSEYLYFLDKVLGSVFVFNKQGQFKAQYSNDEIKSVTQIIVSEVNKKMFLLSGGKLLSLELKHL